MKKTLFSLSAIAVVGFIYAGTAQAQCDFNVPFKAKGLKSDLVKGMQQCGGSAQAVNSASSTGIPSCEPVTELSEFLFGVKGKCSIKTSQKFESPCKFDGSPSCSDIQLKLSCADVLESDGTTPATGPGWTLSTLARTTFEDESGASNDMTIIDFPVTFQVPDASGGKIKAKLSANQAIEGTGGTLPSCTQVELLNIFLRDPNGDIFGAMGSSSRP